MSFSLPSVAKGGRTRPSWSGMAMVVEAMLLLVFLIGSLAVIMQLFAASSTRAQQGRRLAQAVACATETAERFAADPTAVEGTVTQEGLSVSCDVSSEQTDAGTLYHATITVTDQESTEQLYQLDTSRYLEEVQ